MSQQDFEEDWERKKRYLIRSMFSTLPVLSPIIECEEPQRESARSPSETRQSPLPELVVEPAKKTKHDESKRFYDRLEVRMKKYYRHLFYGESMSDFSEQESIHDSYDDDEEFEYVNGQGSDILYVFEADNTADDQQDVNDATNYTTTNLSETAEDSNLHEQLAERDGKHENDESGTGSESVEDTSLIYVVEEESSKSSTRWEIVETQAVIEKGRDIESEAVEEIHKETPASESKELDDLCQGNINSNEVTPLCNPFDFKEEAETNEVLAETGDKKDRVTDHIDKNIKERNGSEEGSVIEISEDSSKSDLTLKMTVLEKEKAIFDAIEKEAKQVAEEETSVIEVEVMREQSHDIKYYFHQEKQFSTETLPNLSPTRFSMEFDNNSGSMTFTPKRDADPTPKYHTSTPKMSLGTKRSNDSFSDFSNEVAVLSKRKRREEIFEPITKDIEAQTYQINANDVAIQATNKTRNVWTETDINSLIYEIIDESGGSREYLNIHTQTESRQNVERGTQTEFHFGHQWPRGVMTRNVGTETDINRVVYETIDESGGGREYLNTHNQTEPRQNMERETQTEFHFGHQWLRGVIGAFFFF